MEELIHQAGLERMRANSAMMGASVTKESELKFVVGDYVFEARVHKPDVPPHLVSTWMGPWRVVPHAGG